jgi:FkbM family methyltransferase
MIRRYTVPGYPALWLRDTVGDHSTFWQCIVQRQYDCLRFPQSERLMSEYRTNVQNGGRPLIIDGGGNIGLSTLYLARLFPKASICVVEPDERNFELLKTNIAPLGDRVSALHGAIWNDSATLQITNPEAGSAAFRVAVASGGSGPTVRAYTISEICARAGVAAPMIVKLDIEGAQAALFRSNTDWVRETHLIMLELDDWMMPWVGTSRSFFECVSASPFDYLIAGETIFCFRDFAADARGLPDHATS